MKRGHGRQRSYLSVHDSAGVTAAEAVRSEVGAVAGLAVDFALAIGGGGGVEPLVADLAGEAALVPLPPSTDDLLGVVDRLATSGTLGGTTELGSHLYALLSVGGGRYVLLCCWLKTLAIWHLQNLSSVDSLARSEATESRKMKENQKEIKRKIFGIPSSTEIGR